MKIIIVGAGIGGLVCAWKLGELGHDVEVFEKSPSLEDMRYDWHDDLTPTIFDTLGIKPPKEHFEKPDWTFVTPFDKAQLFVPAKPDMRDIGVERKPLNALLYSLAQKHAKIAFGKTVTAPVVKDGYVTGVVLDGENLLCDLVIDSAGVSSPVRSKLPAEFAVPAPQPHEIFYAYRAYFNRVEGQSPDGPYSHRVYLKHLGEKGISWCSLDHNPDRVDVLVGRVGELSKGTLERALADLKLKNKWLGDKVLRGGIVSKIPVRAPLAKFVANGYAAIGDAACMTIPMLGSGIASAMKAALILTETVKNAPDMSVKSLWNYQVKVFKDFGAKHCGIEVIKNGLLKMSDDKVTWLFGSGVMTSDDLAGASVGRLVKITLAQIPQKLKAGGSKLHWLIQMKGMVGDAWARAKKAEKIPEEYDEEKIKKWQKSIETK